MLNTARFMMLRQHSPIRDVPEIEVCPSLPSAAATQPVFVHLPMGDVPRRWLPKLRRLSLGPVEGAMVRWSYHDGSTWTNVLFEGGRRDPRAIVGWAVFTLQEARHPIVGVYVDSSRRGLGYGTELVSRLLDACKDRVPHGRIYAVSDWWPKYAEVIAAAGFKQLDWD